MSKSYVLDANAVLDFVEDGPGGKRVEQLLNDALYGRSRVLISVVNWGECSTTHGKSKGRVRKENIGWSIAPSAGIGSS